MAHKEHLVDVCIVGGGAAGLSAAIEAAKAGSQVVVLEKLSSLFESSTAICHGFLSFAGTDLQQREKVVDSGITLYNEMLKAGRGFNDPEMVKIYVEDQLAAYYWLKEVGVEFLRLEVGSEMSVPRGHIVDPDQLIVALRDAVGREGGRILLNTKALEMACSTAGEVVGVKAMEEGEVLNFRTRQGVILASGGFGRNTQMLEEGVRGLSKAIPIAGVGHTGEGVKMAVKLGAKLVNTAIMKPSFMLHPSYRLNPDPRNQPVSLFYYRGGIIVNKEGRRFVNEASSYKIIGRASLNQTNATGYVIFDRKVAESCPASEHPLFNFPRVRHLCVEADTIKDLALEIGVNLNNLQDTVQRYNAGVEGGSDPEFGRATLSGGFGRPVKIDTPPFYAFETTGMLSGTYDAGLQVDTSMHVLGPEGAVIPRLYAAGEIVGGFFGEGYMSGTALAKAVITGRIAGKNVSRMGRL